MSVNKGGHFNQMAAIWIFLYFLYVENGTIQLYLFEWDVWYTILRLPLLIMQGYRIPGYRPSLWNSNVRGTFPPHFCIKLWTHIH